MSRLLLDEHPLMVSPSLAKAVGLNEAIVLQQLHYWLTRFKELQDEYHYRDGRWWAYNTLKGWNDNFPWWSKNHSARVGPFA